MSVPAPQLTPAVPADTIQGIVAFLRGYSIEATKPTPADMAELKSAAPGVEQVFISAVPTRPLADLIEHASVVRSAGFEPVPHLAARRLESAGEIDELLAQLSARASVRRVLVIAGDNDQTKGPFTSAIELIESGQLQRHGIVEIGVAGYPEGHPRISSDVLDRALAAKVEAAAQTGLEVHIVTQFGFAADRIASWIARLRDLGIEHPVRIGMAGPTNLATLFRYARRCGVSASTQGLARQAGLLKHLMGTSAPDSIIRPLAESRDLGKVTAHFFSFGGIGATARWAAAAASGRIVLDRADGFEVEPP